MSCVEYKNITNIFNEQPYNKALEIVNKHTIDLYGAQKNNLELIEELKKMVEKLTKEVKSLKNNEKIVEVWRGNKIITYDRVKNKVTWRYWWADLPWNLIEDLMDNAIKYYYKNDVLRINKCSRGSFYNWKIYHSHTYHNLYEKYEERGKDYCCEGYLNNGKPCKNEGFNLKHGYWGPEGLGFVFDYDTHIEESELLKYTNNYQVVSKGQKTFDDGLWVYQPNMCKRCFKKYIKRGNPFDEWLKDVGYAERNGYWIKTK